MRARSSPKQSYAGCVQFTHDCEERKVQPCPVSGFGRQRTYLGRGCRRKGSVPRPRKQQWRREADDVRLTDRERGALRIALGDIYLQPTEERRLPVLRDCHTEGAEFQRAAAADAEFHGNFSPSCSPPSRSAVETFCGFETTRRAPGHNHSGFSSFLVELDRVRQDWACFRDFGLLNSAFGG